MVNEPNYSLGRDTPPMILIQMIHLLTLPEHVYYKEPKLYKMDQGD
jgi:hypothetical protein